jgi:tyrosinase
MNIVVTIEGADASGHNFLTWSPARADARITDGQPGTTLYVVLRNAGAGGQVVFGIPGDPVPFREAIALYLRGDGTPTAFEIAGRFGSPSFGPDDARIQVVDANNVQLATRTLTVRIRKNANLLTPGERERFLSALGRLNNRGIGGYSDLRSVHVLNADGEAHGNRGFLPWHRAYLLDLERELQRIDPSVGLPYWRFDQPAPNVFSHEFMGVSDPLDNVQFAQGHALEFWATDNQLGIVRRLNFSAQGVPSGVRSERDTLLLGADRVYAEFAQMEYSPHTSAHTSFEGYVKYLTTTVRDPLFFLLHANVDRLWAKWQWLNRRFDTASGGTYARSNPTRVGHDLDDTMWPWNGIKGSPRPQDAPGGPFPPSFVPAPGPAPTVRSMIDFGGVMSRANQLGFAYDDVPFERT